MQWPELPRGRMDVAASEVEAPALDIVGPVSKRRVYLVRKSAPAVSVVPCEGQLVAGCDPGGQTSVLLQVSLRLDGPQVLAPAFCRNSYDQLPGRRSRFSDVVCCHFGSTGQAERDAKHTGRRGVAGVVTERTTQIAGGNALARVK